MQQITVTSDANQEFTTLLGNVEYKLNIWWSDVAASWYITVFDNLGNQIISGARLNLGIPVFAGLVTSFVGDIYLSPLADLNAPFDRNAWGNTYELLYLTPDEIQNQNLTLGNAS